MPTAPEPAPENAAPPHGKEIEVKLAVPKQILASLARLEAFASSRWKPRSQRMTGTYFDTESDDLHRAGMTLRLRQTGVRRILTLKWDLGDPNMFSRGESEVVTQGAEPDIELFCPEVVARIETATKGRALIPRFETRVRRKLGEMRLGETLIEIAIDEGEIVAGDDRLPISECELELKNGDPVALYELAKTLTASGLVINPAQKSDRGYRLARREEPVEKRAPHDILTPAASIEDAMAAIIENTLTQFTGNWPAFLDAERPESVHQMRVALRRLRAALGQFEKAFPNAGFKRFRETAKRLANELGAARDYDVLISLVTRGPFAAFPAETSFEPLLLTLAERRQSAYRIAKDTILAPETSSFVLELQAFVSARGWRNKLTSERLPQLVSPAKDFAGETLARLYHRSRKLGKCIKAGAPEERHELRIALKNLRYSAEFFTSVYDENKVVKFTKATGALQDALGEHNDAASAMNLIDQNLLSAQPRAAGIILGWCAREINAPEIHLTDTWLAFKNVRRFWTD